MPTPRTTEITLPARRTIRVYVIELPDGSVVSRTETELAHAPDELRIAAGLEPLGSTP